MFRRVVLPAEIPGKLLLHSMPGRFEALEKVWQHIQGEAVGTIVCLNEPHEIRSKSWQYAEALERGAVPCAVLAFQISEGGIPANRDAFLELADSLAERLRTGESVLVHCAGGVGPNSSTDGVPVAVAMCPTPVSPHTSSLASLISATIPSRSSSPASTDVDLKPA